MKLSEAIRLGAMATTPARHVMFYGDDGACALGAATIAGGLRALWNEFRTGDWMSQASQKVKIPMPNPYQAFPEFVSAFKAMFPIVETKVTCPIESCEFSGAVRRLDEMITHVNDLHQSTREEIADWVEQIEFMNEVTEPEKEPVYATAD